MKDMKVGKRLHVLSSDSSEFSLKGCDLTFYNKAAMMLNNVNIKLLKNNFRGNGSVIMGKLSQGGARMCILTKLLAVHAQCNCNCSG